MAAIRNITYRVKENVVVKDPTTQAWTPLLAGEKYKASDPLVRKFPKAFVADNADD